MSRLVAAIMRTSTCKLFVDPNRSKWPFSRTRSSLLCNSRGISPISSRKSVDPSAISKRPITLVKSARVGTFLPAEKLAFDQRGRQGGAVDRHQRPVSSAHYSRGWPWPAVPFPCRSRPGGGPWIPSGPPARPEPEPFSSQLCPTISECSTRSLISSCR